MKSFGRCSVCMLISVAALALLGSVVSEGNCLGLENRVPQTALNILSSTLLRPALKNQPPYLARMIASGYMEIVSNGAGIVAFAAASPLELRTREIFEGTTTSTHINELLKDFSFGAELKSDFAGSNELSMRNLEAGVQDEVALLIESLDQKGLKGDAGLLYGISLASIAALPFAFHTWIDREDPLWSLSTLKMIDITLDLLQRVADRNPEMNATVWGKIDSSRNKPVFEALLDLAKAAAMTGMGYGDDILVIAEPIMKKFGNFLKSIGADQELHVIPLEQLSWTTGLPVVHDIYSALGRRSLTLTRETGQHIFIKDTASPSAKPLDFEILEIFERKVRFAVTGTLDYQIAREANWNYSRYDDDRDHSGRLIIARKLGEIIYIRVPNPTELITVTVRAIRDNQVKLGVESSPRYAVHRDYELHRSRFLIYDQKGGVAF